MNNLPSARRYVSKAHEETCRSLGRSVRFRDDWKRTAQNATLIVARQGASLPREGNLASMTSSFRPVSQTPGITKEVYHIERFYGRVTNRFIRPFPPHSNLDKQRKLAKTLARVSVRGQGNSRPCRESDRRSAWWALFLIPLGPGPDRC